jgi:RNA polymerase sigma-70 factor (ECF subfamily)
MMNHNKRSNQDWITTLQASGETQAAALEDLRSIIKRGLPFALTKYLSPSNSEFDDLVEDITQVTLVKVLDHLKTFEGRSQFTTWVHKIAVRQALTELRRRKWKDVSLDEMVEKQLGTTMHADGRPGPSNLSDRNDYLERIQAIIAEDLTEKQRNALVAITINGVPVDEVARRMNTSRNALYKLLHDARLRLKKRLSEEGISTQEVLNAFQPQ